MNKRNSILSEHNKSNLSSVDILSTSKGSLTKMKSFLNIPLIYKDKSSLVDDANLEWLAQNWRKFKYGQSFENLEEMVLHMFSYGYSMFPSPREIKQGL